MHGRARAITALGSSFVLLIGLVGPTAGRDPGLTISTDGVTQIGEPISVAKSRTGQLAETDPALLNRTDATPVTVMIKLDVDPVASYAGDIAGLEATSPEVTGESLDENAAAVAEYSEHLAQTEATAVAAIEEAVPAVTVTDSFQTAYGGLAATMPANQVGALLAVEGVAAVQQDTLQQPLTDATPEFTGASEAWEGLGGPTTAGEGVIVGVLDTGIWPEHPSFEDTGAITTPLLPTGGWGCEFGNGSDPALGDPFTCNDKLIGAYAFVDTYMTFIGAVDGEFCNNTTGECSARDADGHGTHTSSTAAGGPVDSAELFGQERGPISGMAPGAHVIMYRVCLHQGCFGSDSVAAVDQAILDGVDVINFSISGGVNPFTDPVELAFLDAYNAGIVVNASAGNAGPGAGTANHAGPWVTTVAASTSDRHFFSTLHLTASQGDTLDLQGVTITAGITTPTEVVLASAPPYSNAVCDAPAAADSLSGKVVVCERGHSSNGDATGRVAKGHNVFQGGAAGMILYNPAIQQLNSDNHWLPSIHLEGPKTGSGPAAALLTFLESHTGVMATWSSGVAMAVQGDIVASFSSRGPLGDFLKPDVTAPGVQILAGHTPDPHDANIDVGPPGQQFQAIAGTSMSSPHSAGVAALVKAAHPDWTAGQIKSALMTSSIQDVLKEDGVTPADPFDRGAGSIRANRAVAPTVTFDVAAEEYAASAADPLGRIHLNLPSIYANPMPGAVTTTRTALNVSGRSQDVRVRVQAPPGSSITVSPSRFKLRAGAERELTITIDGTNLVDGMYFGQITLDMNRGNDSVLPVAFNKEQGAVSLTHSCDPDSVPVRTWTDCTVTAQNQIPADAQVTLDVTAPRRVDIRNVSPPGVAKRNGFRWAGTLSGSQPPTVDAIDPGGLPYGYLPLADFGVSAIGGMGDESIVNLEVSAFTYGFETYEVIGLTSNGNAIVGGGDAEDVWFEPQEFPDRERANNVLAPFWTDLDFSGGGELRAAELCDGPTPGAPPCWIVADWTDVPTWSSANDGAPTTLVTNSFQIWIGTNGEDDLTFAYGPIGGADPSSGLTVGAENRDGSSGVNLASPPGPPAEDDQYRITTSPPTPGGSVTITYDARSNNRGTYQIPARMTSDTMNGVTIVNARLEVTRR